ncbi:hypothetical protein VP01_228g8 [Puccinia sorghi]|uniref:Uncharacterized protein n=1 Tax=Puccinia sorghi TaxID=27349 RepID=A0A0L6V9W8_9BASI|nr:hypothetical protein VP01_228g8 [Puccinia sorghi]
MTQAQRSSSTDASSAESLTVAFQQMLVDKRDSTTAPGTAPAPAPVPIWQTVVRADSEFLALHQETTIEKILRGWQDKNNPEFSGTIGKDVDECLQTVEILLGDCQAHPGVWHITAGRCPEYDKGVHERAHEATNLRHEMWISWMRKDETKKIESDFKADLLGE